MKLNKIFGKLLVIAALVGLCGRASAQGTGFDWYALDKDIVMIALCSNGVAGATGTNTSQPIDIGHGKFIGSGFIDVWFMTNWGTNTGTITPQSSPDLTNWTTVTNFAVSVNFTNVYTNIYYDGTNGTSVALLATNWELNPFTNQTPNAALAGFATGYGLPVAFTNNAAVTANYSGPTNSTLSFGTRLGFANVNDLSEYLRVTIQYSGTNYFSATFHGRRSK